MCGVRGAAGEGGSQISNLRFESGGGERPHAQRKDALLSRGQKLTQGTEGTLVKSGSARARKCAPRPRTEVRKVIPGNAPDGGRKRRNLRRLRDLGEQ